MLNDRTKEYANERSGTYCGYPNLLTTFNSFEGEGQEKRMCVPSRGSSLPARRGRLRPPCRSGGRNASRWTEVAINGGRARVSTEQIEKMESDGSAYSAIRVSSPSRCVRTTTPPIDLGIRRQMDVLLSPSPSLAQTRRRMKRSQRDSESCTPWSSR